MSAVDPQRVSRQPPSNRGPFASEDEALQECNYGYTLHISPMLFPTTRLPRRRVASGQVCAAAGIDRGGVRPS